MCVCVCVSPRQQQRWGCGRAKAVTHTHSVSHHTTPTAPHPTSVSHNTPLRHRSTRHRRRPRRHLRPGVPCAAAVGRRGPSYPALGRAPQLRPAGGAVDVAGLREQAALPSKAARLPQTPLLARTKVTTHSPHRVPQLPRPRPIGWCGRPARLPTLPATTEPEGPPGPPTPLAPSLCALGSTSPVGYLGAMPGTNATGDVPSTP